ncbi:hypothetical protein ACRAWD_14055 [Caulobacter segnis]
MLVLFVSILGAVGLMAVIARQLDRIEAVDEIEITCNAPWSGTRGLEREVTSATVWDQAYKAMGWTLDAAWADTDFATYYHDQFDHDLTSWSARARSPTPRWTASGRRWRRWATSWSRPPDRRHRRRPGARRPPRRPDQHRRREVTCTGLMRAGRRGLPDRLRCRHARRAGRPPTPATGRPPSDSRPAAWTRPSSRQLSDDLGLEHLVLPGEPNGRAPRVVLSDIHGQAAGSSGLKPEAPG